MKAKIYSLTIAVIFFIGMNKTIAQSNRAGETMFGFGVGYTTFNTYLDNNAQPSLELPELSASVDYFVIPGYSIGLGVAYQSIKGGGNYNINNYPNPPLIGSFTETISRVNVSLRSVVYFNKDARPQFYGGVCIGYEYFTYQYDPFNPNVNNQYPYAYRQQPLTAPTIQAFVGARAMITQGFGTYFEVGTGIPFYAEMGFSFSFGGKPADPNIIIQAPAGPSPYVK
jgi:hypothetical protein